MSFAHLQLTSYRHDDVIAAFCLRHPFFGAVRRVVEVVRQLHGGRLSLQQPLSLPRTTSGVNLLDSERLLTAGVLVDDQLDTVG